MKYIVMLRIWANEKIPQKDFTLSIFKNSKDAEELLSILEFIKSETGGTVIHSFHIKETV